MSDLDKHRSLVEDIADRARAFQANEASDPKAFSKAVVEDLAVLADALCELLKRAET